VANFSNNPISLVPPGTGNPPCAVEVAGGVEAGILQPDNPITSIAIIDIRR
jgi:hypothetical protein